MFDILIVGAGPAGSYLAYLLASKGIKVALIDKKTFPRKKLCGGGLCARSVKLLPFDISPVVEKKITSAIVTLKGHPICHKKLSKPIIYMVSRENFDEFLVKKAIAKGAHFFDQTSLKEIASTTKEITIKTSKGPFKAKLIAGADGALSKTARLLGFGMLQNLLPAIETEIPTSHPSLNTNHLEAVHFDLAIPLHGYGWLFPKKEHISAGLFSTQKKEHNLKKLLANYLQIKNIKNDNPLDLAKGYVIPAGIKTRKQIITNFGLLLGDAAGFADPITGEGIFHALTQAQIASTHIEQFLNGVTTSLKNYQNQIMQQFKKEHIYAWILGSFFYKMPFLSHIMLKKYNKLITDLQIDIITGKRNYKELLLIALLLKRP